MWIIECVHKIWMDGFSRVCQKSIMYVGPRFSACPLMKSSKKDEDFEDELKLTNMTIHGPKSQVKTHLTCMIQGHVITRMR